MADELGEGPGALPLAVAKNARHALTEWEANASPGALNLLLISTGTVEVNRAMNLRSSIVLDQNFQAGSAFGAHGTPMAVLLDAKGRIASEVVAGAEPILALMGGESIEARAVGLAATCRTSSFWLASHRVYPARQ